MALRKVFHNRSVILRFYRVSVISLAELACAVERRRVITDRHWRKWFRHHTELNGWRVEKISLEIVEEAYALPDVFHADPADRITTATARLSDCTILTADKKSSNTRM